MATLAWLSRTQNTSPSPKGGVRFVVPTNPGPYPTTVDADKVKQERQLAEHKAEGIKYETYRGVENYIRRMIVKSIDHEWLAEVESETMGFNHLSPKALLTHLCNVGGSLDHMDVTELISNIQKPWDGIKAPAAHFAQGDKYEHQLLNDLPLPSQRSNQRVILNLLSASGM